MLPKSFLKWSQFSGVVRKLKGQLKISSNVTPDTAVKFWQKVKNRTYSEEHIPAVRKTMDDKWRSGRRTITEK